MIIRPGCAQHIGSRKEQQDSFAFSHIEDPELVKRAGILAVVADGMGGLAMGREAGDAAVKAVISVHEASQSAQDPVMILQDAVEIASRDVLSMAENAGVAGEAGSTLVAVIVKNDKLYWTSVGDSRIYLYRLGELVQLNIEQNYAADLMRKVAAGELSKEEALNNPERAGLTNFIGNPDIKAADASLHPFPILNGDWLILCSDGLFGTLDEEDIREELYGNPNDSCERLIKKVIAQNKQHQDNVTVAILGCGDKEPVTVRTRKQERVDVFQPLPVENKRKSLPILLVLIAFLIAGGVGGYLLYYKKSDLPKPAQTAIISESSNKSIQESPAPEKEQKSPEQTKIVEVPKPPEIQKQHTSATNPKLPLQAEKQDSKDSGGSKP